jgi:hypothetical protein
VNPNMRKPNTPMTSERIRKLALWGQGMCVMGMAIPLGTLLMAMISPTWRDHFVFGGMQMNGGPPVPLDEAMRKNIVYLMVVPILCQVLALGAGWKLFGGYRRGEIFTQSAANRLNLIGWAIFAMAPLGLLTKFVLSRLIAGSAQYSIGGMSLSFSIADIDFAAVAFGLLAILIGRVLGEAAKLSEENQQFV